jgi:hypothetical protein
MTLSCRHTLLPEPPACGLDPTTDLIETVSVIVAQLHDLVELGLMVEVMQEDEARLRGGLPGEPGCVYYDRRQPCDLS